MAQTIILKHGVNTPENVIINKGELLVQHAADKINSALHTVTNTNEQVSFPSKDYVENRFEQLIGFTSGDSVDTRLSAVGQRIDTIVSNSTSNFQLIDTVLPINSFVDKQGNLIDGTVADRIDNLSTKLSGVTDVSDAIKTAKDDILKIVGAGFDDKTITEYITAVETKVNNLDTEYVKESEWTERIEDINKEITKKTVDVKAQTGQTFITVNSGTTNNTGTTFTINTNNIASASELEGVKSNVDTLMGTGATSVTAIAKNAADEVYAKIMSGDTTTTEAFDTLKEIAEWIGEGNVAATDMITDINKLKSALPLADFTGTTTTVASSIAAVDAKFVNYYDTDTIDDKIDTINADIAKAKTTLTEASGVTEGVRVVQSSEDPNNYTITAVGLATSSELSGATQRIETIENDYVKNVKYYNAANQTATTADGNVDLTSMWIDGGEY